MSLHTGTSGKVPENFSGKDNEQNKSLVDKHRWKFLYERKNIDDSEKTEGGGEEEEKPSVSGLHEERERRQSMKLMRKNEEKFSLDNILF